MTPILTFQLHVFRCGVCGAIRDVVAGATAAEADAELDRPERAEARGSCQVCELRSRVRRLEGELGVMR